MLKKIENITLEEPIDNTDKDLELDDDVKEVTE
jgi:hypothetical protein